MLGLFSRGYVLTKGPHLLTFGFFIYLFFPFFPLAMYKKAFKLSVNQGYAYCFYQMFRGLRLMFIQVATSIPDYRVSSNRVLWNKHNFAIFKNTMKFLFSKNCF